MDKVSKSTRKPPEKRGSRKGKPNKNTAALKEMILQALEGAGGVSYLMDRALDPKTAGSFLGLIGKVLPLQITGEGGGAIVITASPLDARL